MLIRSGYRALLTFLMIALLAFPLIPLNTYALTLENRFVDIGSATPSATTTHDFGFDFLSNTDVGSVVFEYCSNSPLFEAACVAPSGLDVSGVSLDSQTGETGFSIDGSTTTNAIVLTRIPVPANPGPSTYGFSNLVNPDTPNSTTFVRISTFATADASGGYTDRGAVAFSTAAGLVVGAYVPPYLTFCVGITVGANCSQSTGTFIDLGQLSTTAVRAASSQMAVATNDPGGYVVGAHGTTMTSGNKIIPALSSPTASQPGVSQFGMNLRANSNPSVGANPSGLGTGFVTASYNTPNKFYYVPDTNVAASTLPTEFTRFTVSYIVNISKEQPKGFYSTTSTFVAVAAF